MSLSIGIVGLPNVGKSTLFNALTRMQAEASNYPFCTIDPNVGIVSVPDKRLDRLSELVQPKKTIPTAIEFVDIAGLVRNAHEGEGLGNQFLSHIRQVDAILHLVRFFEDENISHVDGGVDPARDIQTIKLELALADLSTVEKRLQQVQKQSKSGDKVIVQQKETLERWQQVLDEGQWLSDQSWFSLTDLNDGEQVLLKELKLLTSKPVMYGVNLSEEEVMIFSREKFGIRAELDEGEIVVPVSAKVEHELLSLSDEEAQEYLDELGWEQSGLERLIQAGYQLLDLITYFTAGEKEVRAWTISTGTKAPGAAGVIHTDFAKHFIRAEVVGYQDFVEAGSLNGAKEKGKLRVEGKEYVVQDGDVMHFLHSAR